MTCPGLYAARAGIIVTNELPAGATEKALAGQAFVPLLGLLGLARLPVSTRFNARHGCLREALCVLSAMRRASRFAAPAVASLAGHAEVLRGGKDPVGPAAYCPLAPVAYRPMPARPGRMLAGSVGMTMNGRGAILPPRPGSGRARLTQPPYCGKDAGEIARGGPSAPA